VEEPGAEVGVDEAVFFVVVVEDAEVEEAIEGDFVAFEFAAVDEFQGLGDGGLCQVTTCPYLNGFIDSP
jgi:hypothetical protein